MQELTVTRNSPTTATVAGLEIDVTAEAQSADSDLQVEDMLEAAIEVALIEAGYTLLVMSYKNHQMSITVA